MDDRDAALEAAAELALRVVRELPSLPRHVAGVGGEADELHRREILNGAGGQLVAGARADEDVDEDVLGREEVVEAAFAEPAVDGDPGHGTWGWVWRRAAPSGWNGQSRRPFAGT